ncbi:MAG: cell division protein ZapA [Thermodesulfovibrionales bacterium]
MGSIEVDILGQKYSVRGDAPEEHMRKLAAYVDEKIREVHTAIPNVTPLKAAIIASLTIADEFFQMKEAHENAARNIEAKADALTGLFD